MKFGVCSLVSVEHLIDKAQPFLAIQTMRLKLTGEVEKTFKTSFATSRMVRLRTTQNPLSFYEPVPAHCHQFETVPRTAWCCVIKQKPIAIFGLLFIEHQLACVEIKKC